MRRARVAGRNQIKGETFAIDVPPDMFDFIEGVYEPPAPGELDGAIVSASD